MPRRLVVVLLALLTVMLAGCGGDDGAANAPAGAATATAPAETSPETAETTADGETTGKTEPDVDYFPTPQVVVDRMLEMADVGSEDYVYDLGSGDGRIPITAAREFGARGVGIEIQPQLIELSRENAEEAGVSDLVEFRQGDLFELDLSEATVVTLYLLQELNLQLRPKLLTELEPGTRIVSQSFDMGAWTPDATDTVRAEGNDWEIYMWTVPEDVPDELLEDETE